MTGPQRALLYRLAIETGLRANEIRSLTRASFDLDACTVTVVAGSSKRRRKDVQIISKSLAAELEPFLATKVPAAKAFGGRYQALTVNTADVLKKDLAEISLQMLSKGRELADQSGMELGAAVIGKDAWQHAQELSRWADRASYTDWVE